jgi:maleylacetate reductase
MEPFVYEALPARVVFGHGTVGQLPDEVARLGCARVLLVATPQQTQEAERFAALLGTRCAGTFTQAAMHTPIEVTARAMQVVAAQQVDGVVAVGGGSTTGLSKAIALRSDLPQIIVPTTYAGSEMTPILGETAEGQKKTQRSLKVLPEVVIYDVDLTLTLPKGLSGTSGINAIAHAVEGLYAKDTNPIISLMAEEGIGALSRALPKIAVDPRDRVARGDALYGAFLCGAVLGAAGMALHHKLCHILGGTFDLPHAETHSIILPHALAYNAPAIPRPIARIERVLGTTNAPLRLYELGREVQAPRALKDIGMPEGGIAVAAGLAVANPYWNPAPLEREKIERLIERAWQGLPPA